jgi:hypothetical protein
VAYLKESGSGVASMVAYGNNMARQKAWRNVAMAENLMALKAIEAKSGGWRRKWQ